MKTYRGGQTVGPGIYCSLRTGELTQSPDRDIVLRGVNTIRYVRLPVLLVMALSPIIGLSFVAFLPMIGIVGLPTLIVHRLVRKIWPVSGRESDIGASESPGGYHPGGTK